MKSEVDICNMALGHLGVSMTIMDIQAENSVEARTCRTFFETARDLALEEAPWPFAKRTNDLQIVAGNKYGWEYRYRYPNDCLSARQIITEELTGIVETGDSIIRPMPIPFEVVEDEANGGKAILTDVENAILIYTARITKVSVMPTAFQIAFSLGLASLISGPLSANPKNRDAVSKAYELAISKAVGRAFNEGRERPERESEFTAARR